MPRVRRRRGAARESGSAAPPDRRGAPMWPLRRLRGRGVSSEQPRRSGRGPRCAASLLAGRGGDRPSARALDWPTATPGSGPFTTHMALHLGLVLMAAPLAVFALAAPERWARPAWSRRRARLLRRGDAGRLVLARPGAARGRGAERRRLHAAAGELPAGRDAGLAARRGGARPRRGRGRHAGHARQLHAHDDAGRSAGAGAGADLSAGAVRRRLWPRRADGPAARRRDDGARRRSRLSRRRHLLRRAAAARPREAPPSRRAEPRPRRCRCRWSCERSGQPAPAARPSRAR